MSLNESIISTVSKQYKISLAENKDEVVQAQRIRYEYLRKEYNQDAYEESGLDVDCYDEFSSHMIVSFRKEEDSPWEVVGTYRVTRWEHIKEHFTAFMTESEFDLSTLKRTQLNDLVELSRAVIVPAHRNGVVIQLLWEGIMRYCAKYNTRYIIGTASFHGTDIETCKQGLSHLISDFPLEDSYGVIPAANKGSGFLPLPSEQIDRTAANEQIPSLIKSYSKMNGRFARGIFVDEPFCSIDVFIYIDKKHIPEFYTRRMRYID
ncbi:MAG: GNAT family N-acetyltransferase [Clostridia bacterium]|nr:GNAT family N-acetyltransferase [Clostridia bacterium]